MWNRCAAQEGFFNLMYVIYRAECAFWNCDQTNYVFNYSRLSELRTVLSSPPIWMGQFSQVWEYAVCYRWNCSSKYRRYCNINLSCFKKFYKRIWKKYIHIIHTQCTTPICPPPPFCAPPSKSFPHFVIVLMVLNQ